jgi:hypothetical protein
MIGVTQTRTELNIRRASSGNFAVISVNALR